jgi:methionyl-tRNA formyltransferase
MTGVTIMGMERGLDTGPMFAVRETPVDGKTAGELTDELAAMGAALMVDVLDRLPDLPPAPQPEEGITYAPKIQKHEAQIDFSQSAFNPFPGAFFEYGGERIKILAATIDERCGEPGTTIDNDLGIACRDGAIVPSLVQRAGRGAMTPSELLRGFAIPAGVALA